MGGRPCVRLDDRNYAYRRGGLLRFGNAPYRAFRPALLTKQIMISCLDLTARGVVGQVAHLPDARCKRANIWHSPGSPIYSEGSDYLLLPIDWIIRLSGRNALAATTRWAVRTTIVLLRNYSALRYTKKGLPIRKGGLRINSPTRTLESEL